MTTEETRLTRAVLPTCPTPASDVLQQGAAATRVQEGPPEQAQAVTTGQQGNASQVSVYYGPADESLAKMNCSMAGQTWGPYPG